MMAEVFSLRSVVLTRAPSFVTAVPVFHGVSVRERDAVTQGQASHICFRF